MIFRRTIDLHCASCRGKGEIIVDERSGADGYWCSSSECHCVDYWHDDEMKALLVRATSSVSSPLSKGEA